MTQSPRPWCSAIPARSIMLSARLAPEDGVPLPTVRLASAPGPRHHHMRTLTQARGEIAHILRTANQQIGLDRIISREQLSDIAHPDLL